MKQDVGTESYTEKEKGQASDSFKRACVSLGIGRELYTAPFIWVGASKTRMEQKGNKWVCHDKFTVAEITYNANREITGLVIMNQDGREVYRLQDKSGSRSIAGQANDKCMLTFFGGMVAFLMSKRGVWGTCQNENHEREHNAE
ncbi:MAG: hypothetical protein LUE19_01210 [Clostridiales bacterium]|nr:hypothetical protein [Clostridiales bacterium]